MQTKRVLLICSEYLFGIGMETILRAAMDVDLIGPWGFSQDICQRIVEARPDVVVIAAGDPHSGEIASLTAAIIEQYPELSVIRTGLTENTLRVFSTHTLPGRGVDLLETIRNLPPRASDGNLPKPKSDTFKEV